jgi:sugar O-acyltransferase (sialic acid O-acetyltransferase NeuD family)
MKTNPLILFGAGGHAKVVLDAALSAGLSVQMIVDDNPEIERMLGVKVISSKTEKWSNLVKFQFLVAVGNNHIRENIFRQLESRGGVPQNIIHSSVIVSHTAQMGRGIVVIAGAVINAGTVVGDNCIINTSASVDHDCFVGEHVHLCPGVHLAGEVTVGCRTLIGIGTVVLPGIHIGRDCIVGAGAVVNRDLADGVVAFGVPAKVQRACGLGESEP